MGLIETMLKKGGLAPLPKPSMPVATATSATSATLGRGNKGSVATVATVATVAVASPTADPVQPWEQWQADHPNPGTVVLSTDQTSAIRVWLAYIGETDNATIRDVLATCAKHPDTLAHCLSERKAIPGKQDTVKLAVQEATKERAPILEHNGRLTSEEAGRVSQLAGEFYNHLFGVGQATGCCYGRINKYCTEGNRLRDTYYEAAKAAGRLT